MRILNKKQAVIELRKIIGKDLRKMADEYGVTVFKNGKLNKGWAGLVLEQYLGLGMNIAQVPNGETWELKLVPFVKKNNLYTTKETMAITMINPKQVAKTDFYDSHLWAKLRSLVLCGRLFINKKETSSKLLSVDSIDLEEDEELIKMIEQDYNIVKDTIINKGFDSLTGRMGKFIQPRTKGPGHGSKSRAFYARKEFINKVLNL